MHKIILTILVVLFAQAAVAGNALSVKYGVSVLAVNGKESVHEGFFDQKNNIDLPNGDNQLLVRYATEIGRDANDQEIELTDLFVIKFSSNDQKLRLTLPELKRYRDLEKFNQTPQWKLLNGQGKAIKVAVAKLEKTGFQLVRDYERELEKFNRDSGSEAAIAFNKKEISKSYYPQQMSLVKNPVSNDQQEPNMAKDMLIYWFKQADKKTRKEFKAWVNKYGN